MTMTRLAIRKDYQVLIFSDEVDLEVTATATATAAMLAEKTPLLKMEPRIFLPA
jgi:hypothetical protein